MELDHTSVDVVASDREAPGGASARRVTSQVLTIVCCAALAYYVFDHREELARAFQSSWTDVLALFVLCAAGQWLNASEFWILYRRSGVPVGLLEQWDIYNAGQLGNYLPLQAGTAYRLRYLKVVHGVTYSGAASALAVNVLISVGSTAMCGLIGVVGYAAVEEGRLAWVMLAIFGAMLVAAFASAFVPMPRRLISHPRIERSWREFHRGWEGLRTQRRVALLVLSIDIVKLVLLALRFQLAFHLLGVDDSTFLFLVLGPVAAFTAAYTPIPGGLGVREAAVGGAAAAMGSSIPTGVLAATVDRAVLLVVITVFGTVGYVRTVRKMRASRGNNRAEGAVDPAES